MSSNPFVIVYALLFGASIGMPHATWCFALTAMVMVATVGVRAYRGDLIRLDTAWSLGFVYTICREGLLDDIRIVRVAGQDAFLSAAHFLCAANAATLFGVALFARPTRKLPPQTPTLQPRPLAFVLALYALTMATTIGQAIQQFTGGRLTFERQLGSDLVPSSATELVGQIIIVSVSTSVPALIAYELGTKRNRRIAAVLVSLPIIALQILLGTRYLLLLSVGGLLCVTAAGDDTARPRRVRYVALVAVALLLASAIMARFRNIGLASFSVAAFSDDRPIFNYEDVVIYVALLIRYCSTHGMMWGASTGAILLFWIPRFVWTTKPTLLGYWLPRELGLVKNFSGGYSAAVSFAGDAYLDFGFAGGLLFSVVLGAAIATLDNRLRAALVTRDVTLPLLAPLVGAAFFAVRSLDTTIISYSGIFAVWCVYRTLSRPARVTTSLA